MTEEEEIRNKTEDNQEEAADGFDVVSEDMEGKFPDMAGKIKKLKKELKQCKEECQEYLRGWQRAKADFINARKDEEKSREGFVRFAEEKLLKELLSIVDSFEMAFENKELWERVDGSWRDGIKGIYADTIKILESHNVSKMESKEKEFNPAEHEAVESIQVEDPEKDNKVLQEVLKGYKIFDKVLRPAKVKIGVLKTPAQGWSASGGKN